MEEKEYIQMFRKFQQGKATTEELTILLAWLKERKSFNSWAEMEWTETPSQIDQDIKVRIYNEVRQKINDERRTLKRRRLFVTFAKIAAMIIFLFSIGLVYYNFRDCFSDAVDKTKVITASAERVQVSLPDGSRVWLNTSSSLRYSEPFGKNVRRVELSGEGYFEVKHDTLHPFIVSTKDINVRVTGTKFDVVAYRQDKTTSVVLASGSVNVFRCKCAEKCAKHLSPNQMYLLSANMKETVTKVDASSFVSWVKGVYGYNNETLVSLTTRLERFYHVRIVCSPSIRNRSCSGEVNLSNDVSVALHDIAETLSVRYIQRGRVYYLE